MLGVCVRVVFVAVPNAPTITSPARVLKAFVVGAPLAPLPSPVVSTLLEAVLVLESSRSPIME